MNLYREGIQGARAIQLRMVNTKTYPSTINRLEIKKLPVWQDQNKKILVPDCPLRGQHFGTAG